MPQATPESCYQTLRNIESTLIPPFDEGVIELRDGRRFSYAQFGNAGGLPVLWFHGTPGARRQLPPDAADVALRLGMRIIGIDRPGVGGSCTHPERTLSSWAEDVRELVDALAIERFGLAGLSGGGPHVLAVAHALRVRVTGAALLGTMVPFAGPDAPADMPAVLPKVLALLHAARGLVGDAVTKTFRALPLWAAASAFPAIMRVVPESDRVVLDTPRMRAMFVSDLYRGSRTSFRAQVQDLSALRDWGFSMREISVPVRLWHGTNDQLVPFAQAEHLVSLIPSAELLRCEGEGHFAGFVRPLEVLGWLKQCALQDESYVAGDALHRPRLPTS